MRHFFNVADSKKTQMKFLSKGGWEGCNLKILNRATPPPPSDTSFEGLKKLKQLVGSKYVLDHSIQNNGFQRCEVLYCYKMKLNKRLCLHF